MIPARPPAGCSRANGPEGGCGSPYARRSPSTSRRITRSSRSASVTGTRPSSSAGTSPGSPASTRRSMFGGVRTESRTRRAWPAIRSYAISIPDDPAPATSTSRWRNGSASRYSAACSSRPRKPSRPATPEARARRRSRWPRPRRAQGRGLPRSAPASRSRLAGSVRRARWSARRPWRRRARDTPRISSRDGNRPAFGLVRHAVKPRGEPARVEPQTVVARAPRRADRGALFEHDRSSPPLEFGGGSQLCGGGDRTRPSIVAGRQVCALAIASASWRRPPQAILRSDTTTRATIARAAIERLCALDLPPLDLLAEGRPPVCAGAVP